MVTLSFLVAFLALLSLISVIDMVIYKEPLTVIIFSFLKMEPGTNEWMTRMSLFSGFIYSMVVDYRLRKRTERNLKNG